MVTPAEESASPFEKTFGLTLDALALDKDVKEEIPVWFHPGGTKDLARHNNSKFANCLRDNHGAKTVGHILLIVQRNYLCHYRRRNCACNCCKADRAAGCESPYKCHEEGIKILDCINEKWDPRVTVNQPNRELTKEEKVTNFLAVAEKEMVTFDPSIKIQALSDGFRIYGAEMSVNPAHQLNPTDDEGEPSEVTVFVGCTHKINDDGEHCLSGGLWYGPNDTRNSKV
ncbi:hypothetical protein B0H16DRAFT_1458120 [Mycena metata]|uniref:Uncharacterized protein n=1 Tax=Mycena metata TaxID=1033252 RepID=A0AAD7J5E4_9AGAR|nr:hypothetical protein B0H16DRAFT_1458120 [Mycena metata]